MVPKFEAFLYPFLLMLKEGPLSNNDMKEKLVKYFGLTQEDLLERTRGGEKTKFLDRVDWSRQYLRRAGLINIPKRGIWQLTQRGKDYLKIHTNLKKEDLRSFKEFEEFADGTKKSYISNRNEERALSLDKTPTEQLEDAFLEINGSLAEELLGKVKGMSPSKVRIPSR